MSRIVWFVYRLSYNNQYKNNLLYQLLFNWSFPNSLYLVIVTPCMLVETTLLFMYTIMYGRIIQFVVTVYSVAIETV